MPSGPAVGGILCFYRRCLALVRCSHSLTSSSNFEQATWQYSLTRVARPCRPNTVWFSEITRPLAVTRSRSGPLPVRPAAAGAARAAEAHTFSNRRVRSRRSTDPRCGRSAVPRAAHDDPRACATADRRGARSLYLRFSGDISIYPWHAVTGRRRARARCTLSSPSRCGLRDWR